MKTNRDAHLTKLAGPTARFVADLVSGQPTPFAARKKINLC